MKSFVCTLAVGMTFSFPAIVVAQQSGGPDQGKVDVQQQSAGEANASSYGGAPNATSSGEPQHRMFGFLQHKGANASRSDNCVGPVSYCNIFFGS
ncbi:hypothetical protein [Paraburkholderia sp. C35]|uniref:hypothetical protein n=1 Tax=Paraburkholderia sp. C35 TaxID=2126993 RepID=UPI000D6880D7|nr:hypothetical protein [Paraburkholderia sp. C35]